MKFNIVLFVFYAFSCSCKDGDHNRQRSIIGSKHALPFIGKKYFETRPGFSGTGTPHRAVEIYRNGDVYFSFGQENQADKSETNERYYAGKFAKPLRCVFKKLDNEITYYEVSGNRIFETDANGNRLRFNECCSPDIVDTVTKCACESELTNDP